MKPQKCREIKYFISTGKNSNNSKSLRRTTNFAFVVKKKKQNEIKPERKIIQIL